jgi:hypothetical protein
MSNARAVVVRSYRSPFPCSRTVPSVLLAAGRRSIFDAPTCPHPVNHGTPAGFTTLNNDGGKLTTGEGVVKQIDDFVEEVVWDHKRLR